MIHISRWMHNNDYWTPNPNVEDVLKSCNLSFHNYARKSQWVGTGNTACTDPKTLRKQIGTKVIDLGIKKFQIRTFNQTVRSLYPNDSSLTWKPLYVYPLRDCLTLSLPENLKKLGIFKFRIYTQNPPFPNLMVYVHQNGLLLTDTPHAWQQKEISGKGKHVLAVDHDEVELLKYDGEECKNDKDYKLSECQLEYVEQASDFCK